MVHLDAYEERLVIFMDILGFKDAVNESSVSPKMFDKIKVTLEHIFSEKNKNDEENKKFENYSYQLSIFSDSLIYSTPIDDDNTIFFALVMAEYMQRELLDLGFLTRGGITVGKMVHNQEVAFGPALVEAVELEQSMAIYPRVIMASNSYQKIDERLKQNGKFAYLEDKKSFDALLKKYQNEINEQFYFLDFLSQGEEYDYKEDYLQILKKAKTIVEENIVIYSGKKQIQNKYVWFKNYLLDVCRNKSIQYKNL